MRSHSSGAPSGGIERAPVPAPTADADAGPGAALAAIPSRSPTLGWWTRTAVGVGLVTAGISRRFGRGAGAIIGGRVALVLAPAALTRLAAGRRVVLVSGTNGKTTTSHLLAAALRTAGAVAHNTSGANMADGAVAALAAERTAALAVLEVDELHLAAVAAAVDPAVVVLLNLSRDQLDRGTEVRAVAAAVGRALAAHPNTVVVANADDPMVVWAARRSPRAVWVSTRARWSGDAHSCPRCGQTLRRDTVGGRWWCGGCGLDRPVSQWKATDTAAQTGAVVIPMSLQLPGRFNRDNAVMAMATAALLGVDPQRAAAAIAAVGDIAGRYSVVRHGGHELRLLLAKNPAGWTETLDLLTDARPLLVVVNAREADGRDTSWLWDVAFEQLAARPTVAAGERAADLGVRLSYAGIDHATEADPLAALALLPPGPADVVANYSAFHRLRRRLSTERATDPGGRSLG